MLNSDISDKHSLVELYVTFQRYLAKMFADMLDANNVPIVHLDSSNQGNLCISTLSFVDDLFVKHCLLLGISVPTNETEIEEKLEMLALEVYKIPGEIIYPTICTGKKLLFIIKELDFDMTSKTAIESIVRGGGGLDDLVDLLWKNRNNSWAITIIAQLVEIDLSPSFLLHPSLKNDVGETIKANALCLLRRLLNDDCSEVGSLLDIPSVVYSDILPDNVDSQLQEYQLHPVHCDYANSALVYWRNESEKNRLSLLTSSARVYFGCLSSLPHYDVDFVSKNDLVYLHMGMILKYNLEFAKSHKVFANIHILTEAESSMEVEKLRAYTRFTPA